MVILDKLTADTPEGHARIDAFLDNLRVSLHAQLSAGMPVTFLEDFSWVHVECREDVPAMFREGRRMKTTAAFPDEILTGTALAITTAMYPDDRVFHKVG